MLSKKAQYALHALTYLAERHKTGYIQIAEIAQQRNISVKFLEAILLEFKKVGVLGSKIGKGGGYYFLKDPKDVPIVQIIRLMDGPVALLPCVSKLFYEPCQSCGKPEGQCELHAIMVQVRDVTLGVLESKTLHDLISQEFKLPPDFVI
jgi:Rrf2 family protein